MAIIKGAIQMTGSVKGMTFYTRRGSDQVIMRTKGGVTKEKMKSSPKYETLRKHQQEWGACARFGSIVRYCFGGLHRLADYNLTPALNGIAKNVVKGDESHEIGVRSLLFSNYRHALEGFNFNRNYPFNTVLRVSVSPTLNREQLQATVAVPRINTDIDVLNVQRLPFFRLIVVLGTVSDVVYNAEQKEYEPLAPDMHGVSETLTGQWHSANTVLDPQTLTVQLPEEMRAKLTDNVSVLLSMAIEFGTVGFTGQPVEVKYAGSGKVLCVR